jgi:hypothetical protein
MIFHVSRIQCLLFLFLNIEENFRHKFLIILQRIDDKSLQFLTTILFSKGSTLKISYRVIYRQHIIYSHRAAVIDAAISRVANAGHGFTDHLPRFV